MPCEDDVSFSGRPKVGQRVMKSAELLCLEIDFLVGRKSAHTKDEPWRADISLGSSLLCETEQKNQ